MAESFRRLTEVEAGAKLAVEKQGDPELQVARSTRTAEGALRRLTDSSRRVELFEEEALGLKSQLGKTVKARDSAVAESNSRPREVKALEARVRLLGDGMDSLKRRE